MGGHTAGGRRQTGLLGALDRDWPCVTGSGPGRRAWASWAPQLRAGGLELTGLDDVVAVFRRPGDHTRSDIVARLLIAAAQAGDGTAARTLVQGLLPFAGRLAGLYARYGPADPDDAVAEVMAAVQLRIARTRLDQRDRLLVHHLQLTVRRELGRPASRRILRRGPEAPADVAEDQGGADDDALRRGDPVHPPSSRCSADHVASIVADGVRAGHLSIGDAELLLLVAAGHTAAAIARRLQRGPTAVYRQLQRATRDAGRRAA